MAQVIYETIKKPIDKRLEEAACIYYDVQAEFFRMKGKDNNTDKRRVLFYLLFTDGGMGYSEIGYKYGQAHNSISEGIQIIEFRAGNSRQIADSISTIRQLATNLDAKMVVVDVKLESVLQLAPVPQKEL